MLPSCCWYLLIRALSLVKSSHVFTCFLHQIQVRAEYLQRKTIFGSRCNATIPFQIFQVHGFCMFPPHLQSLRNYCNRGFPSDWRIAVAGIWCARRVWLVVALADFGSALCWPCILLYPQVSIHFRSVPIDGNLQSLVMDWKAVVGLPHVPRSLKRPTHRPAASSWVEPGCCTLNFQRLRSFSGGSSSEKRSANGFVWFRAPWELLVILYWTCHFGIPQCSGCISPRIPQMIPHSDGFNHQFSWLNPKVFTRFLTSLFCGRWRCLRFLFFEDGTQLFDEEGNELYGEREWYAEEDGQSWGVTKWGVMLVDAGC